MNGKIRTDLNGDHADPRKILERQLLDLGIDAPQALIIALDYGIGAVDRNYLMDMELPEGSLSLTEKCVREFIWLNG